MKQVFGYIITVIGVALALFVLVALIRDFAYMASLGDPETAAESGYLSGGVIGMIIRSFVLLAVSAGVILLGLGWAKPEKYGRDVLDAAVLREIYNREDLHGARFDGPVEPTRYNDKSDAELADIYRNINATHYQENAAALMLAIKTRVEGDIGRVFE